MISSLAVCFWCVVSHDRVVDIDQFAVDVVDDFDFGRCFHEVQGSGIAEWFDITGVLWEERKDGFG